MNDLPRHMNSRTLVQLPETDAYTTSFHYCEPEFCDFIMAAEFFHLVRAEVLVNFLPVWRGMSEAV